MLLRSRPGRTQNQGTCTGKLQDEDVQTVRGGDVLSVWSALPIPARALLSVKAQAGLYRGDLIECGLLKITFVVARGPI